MENISPTGDTGLTTIQALGDMKVGTSKVYLTVKQVNHGVNRVGMKCAQKALRSAHRFWDSRRKTDDATDLPSVEAFSFAPIR
jgi:hypothetical protein